MGDIFKTLTTSSDFRRDWYGHATNQPTHTLIGAVAVGIICALTFITKGDLPYKENILLGIAVVYGIKELLFDKWNGFDTIEDFIFLVGYGSGGTLLTFTQTKDCTTQVGFDVYRFSIVLLLFLTHLSIGIAYRICEANDGTS